MVPVPREQWSHFRSSLADRAGSLAARHCIATGQGEWHADRCPDPRAALAFIGSNLGLWGDPAALDPSALVRFVDEKRGEGWERVLLDVDGP